MNVSGSPTLGQSITPTVPFTHVLWLENYDCRVEVIMKDNHTIGNDPRRVVRWVQIAREEAERV